jgi:hypothetical protein
VNQLTGSHDCDRCVGSLASGQNNRAGAGNIQNTGKN